jgi:RNA polymerase-interacting CarD/CdnL/TRCF family regulator
MTMLLPNFKPGEWVVHRQYGIGRIAGIEEKQISGETTSYCRLDTSDGTVYVPVALLDGDSFRPIASQEEIEQALAVLQEPARQMATRFEERRQRIQDVRAEHSLVDTARLIRDLWVRQTMKSLTLAEQRALRHLVECLLREWSLATELRYEEAEERLYATLRQHHLQ